MEKVLEKSFTGLKGMSVVVTGATGFIGRHLVERLLQEEARLEIVTRNRRRVPQEWQGRSSVMEKDIAEGTFQLDSRAEVVFHCAGEIRDPRRFYKANVEGTRNVLNACVRNGIKRFVYLSSVGVIGMEKPGTFDETSPCFPKNDYEQSKLEAEKLALETGQREGLSVAILRPSIVYGPGKLSGRDSFLSLIRSIKRGYFRYIGTKKSIYNIICVGDIVEALLYLAISPVVEKKKIFIINDPMAWGDFVPYIQSLLHVERKVGTIPKMLAFSLALGGELGALFGAKVPFSITRFKALTSETIFSSERLRKETDFKFLYGNREGLRNTVNYYRQNNLL